MHRLATPLLSWAAFAALLLPTVAGAAPLPVGTDAGTASLVRPVQDKSRLDPNYRGPAGVYLSPDQAPPPRGAPGGGRQAPDRGGNVDDGRRGADRGDGRGDGRRGEDGRGEGRRGGSERGEGRRGDLDRGDRGGGYERRGADRDAYDRRGGGDGYGERRRSRGYGYDD